MSDLSTPPNSPDPSAAVPTDTVVRRSTTGATAQADAIGTKRYFGLRRPVSPIISVLLGLTCIFLVLGVWWFITYGEHEERWVRHYALPSPAETLNKEQISELWFENTLTRNLFVTLRRVVLGFSLAAAVAIPLGVLCGCFPWVNAFFAPVTVFGRNIPLAALIALTFALFGTGEYQKVMFIFIAVVAFIMVDTATAIADVSSRYVDTALTLGATRKQVITKVLVPLAMPRLFNSLRLLFGLAFGYIMLTELVTEGGGAGGIGKVILIAQRRGHPETIILILLVIPAVALFIDRLLYLIQKSLFPHQYGGSGILHDAWRGFMHVCEDIKHMVITPTPLQSGQIAALAAEQGRHPAAQGKNS